MHASAASSLIVLTLTCVGCGSPTREAAAEAHVTRALDELALGRPGLAEERLLTALRLDPSSGRAGALLQLVRPRADGVSCLESPFAAEANPGPLDPVLAVR